MKNTDIRRQELIASYEGYRSGKLSGTDYFLIVWIYLKTAVKSSIMANHRLLNENEEDLFQEAAAITLDKLDSYDPHIAMPSVYFLPYINEAHRRLCLKGKSIYYSSLTKKLNAAAQEAGFTGIDDRSLSDVALSALSGESLITVRHTRYMSYIWTCSGDDNGINDIPYMKTPEQIFFDREMIREALTILTSSLSRYEQAVFILFTVERLSAKEIVKRLAEDDRYRLLGLEKCPSDTAIRQVIYRCRKKLKKCAGDDIREKDLIEESSLNEFLKMI